MMLRVVFCFQEYHFKDFQGKKQGFFLIFLKEMLKRSKSGFFKNNKKIHWILGIKKK